MDVVALGLAKADAAKKYLTAKEGKRRRAYPLNLVPASALATQPTKVLTKAVGAYTVTAVTAGGTGYVAGDQITIAGGTGPYSTVLQVSTASGGVITAATIVRAGVYSTAPTNPAAQASTTGSGTGATFTLNFQSYGASSVTGPQTVVGPTATNTWRFLGTGPANIGSSGYYGNASNNGVACIWEWTTDAAQIDVKLIGLSTNFTLFVNGQRLDDSLLATDSSGAPYVYSLAWGSAVPRTYRLFAINCAFGGVNVPATASVWPPTELRRPLAWSLGDSYTYGTNAAAPARAAINGMAELLGLDVAPDGVGGSGWNTASPSDPVTRINARLAALTQTPDIVFFDLGYNDAGGNMTSLASNFDSAVTAVRAIVPAAPIIVFGPATPLGSTANLSTVKSTLQGRCTAWGLPYVDVDNWVNSVNKTIYTGGDGTHPTQAGYDYLAARRAQVVASLLA